MILTSLLRKQDRSEYSVRAAYVISESWARSNRYTRARSSESARLGLSSGDGREGLARGQRPTRQSGKIKLRAHGRDPLKRAFMWLST